MHAERLEFQGDLNWNTFREMQLALADCIDRDQIREVEINLAGLKKVFPNGAVPLIVLIDGYRSSGVADITISGYEQHTYLYSYDYISQLDPRFAATARMQPQALHRFNDDVELNALINKKIDQVLSQAQFASGVMTAFEWFLNEIAGNVLVHSQTGSGWLQVVVHPKTKHIAVAVADGGIGIPESIRGAESLAKQYGASIDDGSAIEIALRDGVTSKPDFGQGKGLTGTMSIVKANVGGRLAITSKSGRVFYNAENGLKVERHAPSLHGTFVDIQLKFDEPIEIERALWGHSPVGFTELIYGKDRPVGVMRLPMKDQASSFGNRVTAQRIRLKIENLLTEAPRDSIEIDFAGVSMLASSFADEVFGKLAISLGVVGFSRRVILQNLNPFCQGVIDDVIQSRMAHAYAAKRGQ